MAQPAKVTNPAPGQLNSENVVFLTPFAPENLVSRDRFGRSYPAPDCSFSALRLNLRKALASCLREHDCCDPNRMGNYCKVPNATGSLRYKV